MDDDAVFITESGKYTKRKFSISGGSVGLFEGKRIGRAKNLEKLQKEIKHLESKSVDIKDRLDEKQRELAKLKADTFKSEIEGLQQEFNQLNGDYISIKTKKEQLHQMLSSHATKREDISKNIKELNSALTQIKPKIINEEKLFNRLASDMEDLERSAKEESERLSKQSHVFNEKNILFHQRENKFNSIKQEISYKETAYESSKERIEKNHLDLEKNETEIKNLLNSSESNEGELIGMYDEKELIEKGVNEAEKDYYAQRGDIDVADKTLRELQHKRENADTLLMELQNQLNETKLEMTSVKERLAVEFSVDLDAILREENQIVDDRSVEELQAAVIKKRDKLEKMGPINPMAMEAYDEIKERHTFISEQKNDLVEAKDSLLQTINEIDTVAKETFLNAFAQIKENFIQVFRSLFTDEDDCDLKLVEPDNPLESAIEIMAKPKGKRPLTINQLSGGEKTLTATSLLFSIYLLKPAPFCIFDEVDAPLDDANIDKFNNIIKKFSDDSQFIIVTHNKRTMASTDIIYGITMIEQGVSRVVPVDLRELAD
jgi:chromosome segregation protein